jgi:archaemetzincin
MLLVVLMAALPSSGRSPAEGAHVIALAPVGDVDDATLRALAPVVAERFGARVEIAPRVPLPPHAWDATRRQWRSGVVLAALAERRAAGWERLVGVADVDLYAPPLNFVFGEADPVRQVAVFSLLRLHAAGRARFVHRAETEVVHELGHTYGLGHCDDPRCVMWFSNTLAETDKKGTRFCAAHAAELARRLTRRSPS